MSGNGTATGVFTIDADAFLEREAAATVERVAEGLWTVAVDDHRVVFAEGEGSVVAINTLGTPAAARALGEAIAATLPGRRISTLVCSIDHLDHSGFGEVLAPDAEVLAHDLCARVMRRRGASGQRPADRVVQGEGEELVLDGVRVRAMYPGPTMGTGNLALHFPDRRVLFVVGPRADARYGLFADVHLRHVTGIWRRLAELDVDVVVPGRGPLMDRDGLRRAADYLDAVDQACQQAFAQGMPIWVYHVMKGFVGDALRERFGELDGFERHVGIGAIRVVHHYVMGGWGMEDTAAPEVLLEAGR